LSAKIDGDMRAVIDTQHLCFAATVNPDGRPNLSPKCTIRVFDDSHLFFCDIASPRTRRNLETNPWIEVNVVDPLSRRGYRFFGKASLHREDEVYRKAVQQIGREEGTDYRVHSVVLIDIERAASLISPGYLHVTDEYEMRRVWKERRKNMEAEFEARLTAQGPYSRNRTT